MKIQVFVNKANISFTWPGGPLKGKGKDAKPFCCITACKYWWAWAAIRLPAFVLFPLSMLPVLAGWMDEETADVTPTQLLPDIPGAVPDCEIAKPYEGEDCKSYIHCKWQNQTYPLSSARMIIHCMNGNISFLQILVVRLPISIFCDWNVYISHSTYLLK